MADICISYDSRNRLTVKQLVDVLSRTYDVWWDGHLGPGDYRSQIERQIRTARCVLVLWSEQAHSNPNVVDEASLAHSSGIPLLSVMIDDSSPAPGFGTLQRFSLHGWAGDAADPRFTKLASGLAEVLSKAPEKATSLVVGSRELPYPILFQSVSSHETQLPPAAALRLLTAFGTGAILVSAYDVVRRDGISAGAPKGVLHWLRRAREAGALVALDSGNYEASRRQDASWTESRLHEAFRAAPHDLAFTFDKLKPRGGLSRLVGGVLCGARRDARHAAAPLLPIIHAPRRDGAYDLQAVPEAMRQVALELRPYLMAIPERELGDGIIARAATVRRIRAALDKLPFYQPLHILGTGNPVSIALLTAVGADSFDGLEWCRVVMAAEFKSIALYHFHQYDLFSWQDAYAASPVTRAAPSDANVKFPAKVAFHNLDLLSEWVRELSNARRSGKIGNFLLKNLPTAMHEQLEAALPEVL